MLINRLALLSLAVIAVVSPLRAEDELQKRATWQSPSVAEVKAAVDQWLAGQKLDDPAKAKIAALWAEDQLPAVSADVLDRVAETIALADAAARDLVAMCRGGQPSPVPTAFDVLQDNAKPPLVRNNLRLLFGRWLAQHALYDEALDQLNALQPDQVDRSRRVAVLPGRLSSSIAAKGALPNRAVPLDGKQRQDSQTIRAAGRIDGSGLEAAEDRFAGRSLPHDG